MAGKRIFTTLDPELHEDIMQVARAGGVSISSIMRALLRTALDHAEDAYWAREGEKRLATWEDSNALTHEDVWRQEGT